MKPTVYILTLVLGLLSCNNGNENKAEKTTVKISDTLVVPSQKKTQPTQAVEIDPSKIECVPRAYKYGDTWTNFSPGAFAPSTFLYNSAKSEGKIIDTLQFNTPVNILAEFPDFFLVCTNKGKSGYVKKIDLYLHSILSGGVKNYYYLFGINKYGTNDNTSCATSKLKVVKINDVNTILNEYNDSIKGKDYEIKWIYNSALKNAEAIFFLHYHCYSEIGVMVDHFIVDNGKQLSRLILTNSSGDGGYSDISSVYLPVTLTNGQKIVLAKNGVLSIDLNHF